MLVVGKCEAVVIATAAAAGGIGRRLRVRHPTRLSADGTLDHFDHRRALDHINNNNGAAGNVGKR